MTPHWLGDRCRQVSTWWRISLISAFEVTFAPSSSNRSRSCCLGLRRRAAGTGTTGTGTKGTAARSPTACGQCRYVGGRPRLAHGRLAGVSRWGKPLLAKLAVHDREQSSYTFVNRSGIKMRQISGRELRQLIENGLVDILETRSKFREEITRARQQGDD